MRLHEVLWLLYSVGCFSFLTAEDVIVATEYGTIRGQTSMTQYGTTYNKFLGIPYAQPPVGELRYKLPQPPTSWSGVQSALQEGPDCAFYDGGKEDCLYMNVFVPKGSNHTAVAFYVYGGKYNSGSSRPWRYGPDYFMDYGVIFVDFSYRTGAIGFLSLQTEEIPGNLGLKDMVFALMWVKRNIAAFGGDPNKITIIGQSSGASAVAHLFISPATAGLYRAAVVMSGHAFPSSGLELNPRQKAYRLAESMGFRGRNDKELAAFLTAANVTELTKDDERAMTNEEARSFNAMAWMPAIEPPSDSAIIVESPVAILKEGRFNHVPLLTGIASADGYENIKHSRVLADPARAADFKENFTLLVAPQLQLATEQERVEAAHQIEHYYFGEEGFTADKPQQVVDLCSDMYWFEPSEWMVRTVSNLSRFPVYYYYFDYNGTGSNEFGSPHAHELQYLVIRGGFEQPDQDPESMDGKVKALMMTTWTNFIKFGEPAPGRSPVLWEPYTTKAHNYLEITTKFVQKQDPVKERMDFWLRTVPMTVLPVHSSGAAAVLGWTTLCLGGILCSFAARLLL